MHLHSYFFSLPHIFLIIICCTFNNFVHDNLYLLLHFLFGNYLFLRSARIAGVISGALLYIKDDFEEVKNSNFLQV